MSQFWVQFIACYAAVASSSILKNPESVYTLTESVAAQNQRFYLTDASFDELETMGRFLEQAQENLFAYLETQELVSHAIQQRFPCRNKSSQPELSTKTKTLRPWQIAFTRKIRLDDASGHGVGLPQRLVYVPKFLKPGELAQTQWLPPTPVRYVDTLTQPECGLHEICLAGM